MSRRNNNGQVYEVPGAADMIDKLKVEVAAELGIANYDKIDKGDIPARIHGRIGGNVVRKLVTWAEVKMLEDPNVVDEIAKMNIEEHPEHDERSVPRNVYTTSSSDMPSPVNPVSNFIKQ